MYLQSTFGTMHRLITVHPGATTVCAALNGVHAIKSCWGTSQQFVGIAGVPLLCIAMLLVCLPVSCATLSSFCSCLARELCAWAVVPALVWFVCMNYTACCGVFDSLLALDQPAS